MAGAGVLVNEYVDEFPKIERPGAGRQGRQRTDVDVALEQLVAMGEVPSKAVRLIDYTVDAEGNQVDPTTAATRASARVQAMRKRGYTKDDGWKFAAISGSLWAQYFGPGGHPVSEKKASENGQEVAPGQVPAPTV